MHIKTRRILKFSERPIISIKKTTANILKISTPQTGISIKLNYLLKNIGKYPAINLRIRAGSIPKNNPKVFDSIIDKKWTNKFDPDFEFMFTQEIIKIAFEDAKISVKENGVVHIKPKKTVIKKYKFYTYLLISYENLYKPGKLFYDEYWFFYTTGTSNLIAITDDEKRMLTTMVTKKFPERKEVKY